MQANIGPLCKTNTKDSSGDDRVFSIYRFRGYTTEMIPSVLSIYENPFHEYPINGTISPTGKIIYLQQIILQHLIR